MRPIGTSMMKLVLVVLVCLAAVGLASARASNLKEWIQYKRQHGKVYESAEEDARRFSLFLATKDKIERHNAKNLSHKLGLNHLSDWTEEEFRALTGFRPQHTQTKLQHDEAMDFLNELIDRTGGLAPDEFDWRKVPGRVTSVKNQGHCASDWAFSAVGALEGQEMVRGKVYNISLSAQQLIDCSPQNSGCIGGHTAIAFEDIHTMGGIVTSELYPYRQVDGECQFNKSKAFISDDGVLEFQFKGEEALKLLVAHFGPVSVDVATQGWQSYKSGVFYDEDCAIWLNHSALVVGYGTELQGDYWIIKNSWGKDWGESGYMRLERGSRVCGIGNKSMIPKWNK